MKLLVQYQGRTIELDAALFCSLDSQYGLLADAIGIIVLGASMVVVPNASSSALFQIIASLLLLRILLRETSFYKCVAVASPQGTPRPPPSPPTPSVPVAPVAPLASEPPPGPAPATPMQVAQQPRPAGGYNPLAFWQGCVGSASRRLPSLKCGRGYAHYIPDSQQEKPR